MGGTLSNLLIAEPPLQVLPTLAEQVGINEAVVLQQIHYWSLQKAQEGQEPWVYNTQDEWLEHFPWLTMRTLQRVLRNLRDAGLLLSRQPEGTNRRTHYLVSYDNMAGSHAANMAASMLPDWRVVNKEQRQQDKDNPPKQPPKREKKPKKQQQPQNDSSPPRAAVISSSLTPIIVAAWACYLDVMKPRLAEADQIPDDDRKILREAAKVAKSAEPLEAAIRTCAASDYHMKRGAHKDRPGGKYKSLGQIFKPRPTKGETWRSRLEWWLEKAEELEAGKAPDFEDVNERAKRIREEQGL